MRNGALLVVIAGSAVLNGMFLDRIPAWRQLLFVVLAMVAYLHGRRLPVHHAGMLQAGAAATALPAAYAMRDPAAGLGAVMALGLFVTLPWSAGRLRRQQADLVSAGAQRVAQLERERAFVAEHVRLRERARIAADMHDSLGHELALIALRAGGLELATDMTERNREAAAKLRASAVTATDRLRHTVGLLRASASTPTEVPDESLQALVDRARDAGMTVRLHCKRAFPAPDSRVGEAPAPNPTDRAAHRVVQEALTNAARHAPGAEVDVRVAPAGAFVTVTVTNPLPPATRPSQPNAGTGIAGTGIAGMREHVSLVGGTLRAGAEHGLFTVTACLPAIPPTGPATEARQP